MLGGEREYPQQCNVSANNTNNYNQTIARTVWGMGRGPSEQARGHWNGNKCWDQDIENIGEEEERWGTNCDPLEIDDGCSDGGDGNGRGNDANGGAVLC